MKSWKRRVRRWRILPALALAGLVASCGANHSQIAPPPPVNALLHSAHARGTLAAQQSLSARRRAEDFGQPPPGDFGLSPTQRHQQTASGVVALRGCDGVTVSNCHARDPVQVFGCYVTGFLNCGTAAAVFPNARRPTISLSSGVPASYYDIEPGGGLAYLAPVFYRLDRAHGIARPGFYSSASMMPSVDYYLEHAGISISQVNRWVADWDGNPVVPAGFQAKQWASPNNQYDADTFLSSAFGAAQPPPPPKPKPKPKPKPVVYNFTWFCHSKPAAGLICGPFNVPFNEHGAEHKDWNNERSIYRLYVTARAKSQTGKRVRYVAELKDEAHGLFNRLENAIRHAPKPFNVHYHRYGRAAILKAIYEDQAKVSWSRVNGG